MATYTSQYPTQDDDHVKATTKYTTDFWPYFATDPAKSLTGSHNLNCWFSGSCSGVEQRFHIDLGSAKTIKRIYYENAHHEGGVTNRGVNNFTLWGSNTAGSFAELTYGIDTGWTQITTATSVFIEHPADDIADPHYITITNSTAYRYYAFKFVDNHTDVSYLSVRRIELQTEDVEFEYVGTGSLTYSGSGICQYEKPDWEYIGSGTYNFSGVGLYSLGLFYVGVGQLIYSGSATQVYTHCYLYEGSGVFSYSGEAVLRWGDWAEITKEASNFIEIDKETSNWSKVEKGESDWEKTVKL